MMRGLEGTCDHLKLKQDGIHLQTTLIDGLSLHALKALALGPQTEPTDNPVPTFPQFWQISALPRSVPPTSK